MLGLRYDTPEGWASRALEEPGALLLDHLFCEQKAAAMAMPRMVAIWPRWG